MLSQDTSRNFLHSNNPSAKYKLFMRGTHLEQIAHDYASAEEKQKLMQEEIIRKKSMLPLLQSRAKELEEEVQGNQVSTCNHGYHVLSDIKPFRCKLF